MTAQELDSTRQSVYEILNQTINEKQYGMFCDLHDPALYDVEDENAHNCIGCNLDEYSQIIVNAIQAKVKSEFELFSRFIINAYVLNERIKVYQAILQISDADFNVAYPARRPILKWANFIKHPKAFMFVHTPEYTFEGSADYGSKISGKEQIINQAFVDRYYSSNSIERNLELFNLLNNKKNVLVVFPDIINLAGNFATDCKGFINSLLTNAAYRHALKDTTTLANFFSQPEPEE